MSKKKKNKKGLKHKKIKITQQASSQSAKAHVTNEEPKKVSKKSEKKVGESNTLSIKEIKRDVIKTVLYAGFSVGVLLILKYFAVDLTTSAMNWF